MSNDHLTDIAYRHFIESVKDYAIYMLSADGTVISWNEGARRAKGYLSDEIIGRYFGLFYSEAEQLSGVPAKIRFAGMNVKWMTRRGSAI